MPWGSHFLNFAILNSEYKQKLLGVTYKDRIEEIQVLLCCNHIHNAIIAYSESTTI